MKFLNITLLGCLLTTTLYSEENAPLSATTSITVESNDNNPGIELIRDIQDTLLEFTQNVINRSDDQDYDCENFYLLAEAFEDFYDYIIQVKAKPKIHVLILFFEFCKPIFKYGQIAKLIAQQDDATRELIFLNFVMSWQALFEEEVQEMQNDLETIIIGNSDSSELNNPQNVS